MLVQFSDIVNTNLHTNLSLRIGHLFSLIAMIISSGLQFYRKNVMLLLDFKNFRQENHALF